MAEISPADNPILVTNVVIFGSVIFTYVGLLGLVIFKTDKLSVNELTLTLLLPKANKRLLLYIVAK